MDSKNVSRRRFVGGLAAALGYVSTGPNLDLFAQGRAAATEPALGGGNRGGSGRSAIRRDRQARQ